MMELALQSVLFKWLAIRRHNEHYGEVARICERFLGLNSGLLVMTGIPLEFQLGTNWSQCSSFAGGIESPDLS
ncbi:MAG: cytochrome ubiquinol oxidase subunit I [Planctomycetales bacterium]